MTHYRSLAAQTEFSHDDLVALLSAADPHDIETVRQAAESVLLENCGNAVFYRGLTEASNVCSCDCGYCGIRKSNRDVNRYTLSADEIFGCAQLCASYGYGSIVIQSGERRDKAYIRMLEGVLRRIKEETKSEQQPDGLGVTLCIGEQTREVYQRLFDAGAHRYLLRIETSDPDLFARIHPAEQTFKSRVACLETLRAIGYQVGTGVMIGLPGQTLGHLARDIQFFAVRDIDMIGMGPFIPHEATPLASAPCPEVAERLRLSLLMIAATRLKLRNVNIAATTALQALDPIGREKGLRFGANIIMPQITPVKVRRDYLLYPSKPCLDENAEACRSCLELRIFGVNRVVGYNSWGDSAHARARQLVKRTDEQRYGNPR
jgi:biotin synthase